ncbi:MAG: hypothetical protein KIT79_02175 [Deltaproteobacteria bacterium]|nr:hypothetical protein [Deltaproteobacteria bacterium]
MKPIDLKQFAELGLKPRKRPARAAARPVIEPGRIRKALEAATRSARESRRSAKVAGRDPESGGKKS